jgi:hypothetical protein
MLLYVADDPQLDVSPLARVAGLPIAERVVRAGVRAGFERILVFGRMPGLGRLARIDRRVTIVDCPDAWRRDLAALPGDARLTAVGPGTIVSTALMKTAMALAASGSAPVDVPAGLLFPVSGLLKVNARTARDLPRLANLLRDRTQHGDRQPSGEDVSHGRAQLAIRVDSADALAGAEETLRRATFKQTDAKIARFNRRISLPISIALLPTPVTANMMSLFVFALGLLSAWLFSRGE